MGVDDITNGLLSLVISHHVTFFFGNGLNRKCINGSPSNLEELELEIRDMPTNVPAEFLRKGVMEEVPDRLRKLTERNGGYVEI